MLAMVQENAVEAVDERVDELKPGTKLLQGQYKIERFINAGGFGMTYLARNSLDREVVIKECFPGSFCRRSNAIVHARSRAHEAQFAQIVKLFVQEAKSLSKLVHPNIVGVHQVFEDNATAYMAMDFIDGRDLLEIIEKDRASLTPQSIVRMLKKLLGAVAFIHDNAMLHRDISPDNILVTTDGEPILIDFGAARQHATHIGGKALSALRVVKDGYSPQEFYVSGSLQNASSDLYALAATFHHAISGEVPPDSQARLVSVAEGGQDPYHPLDGRIDGYPEGFLAALDDAMKVLPRDRIQSAREWLARISQAPSLKVVPLGRDAEAAPRPAPAAALPDRGGKRSLAMLLSGVALIAVAGVFGVLQVREGSGAPAQVSLTVADDAAAAVTDVSEPEVQPAIAAIAPVVLAPTDGAPNEASAEPQAAQQLPMPSTEPLEPVMEAASQAVFVPAGEPEDAAFEPTVADQGDLEPGMAAPAEPEVAAPVPPVPVVAPALAVAERQVVAAQWDVGLPFETGPAASGGFYPQITAISARPQPAHNDWLDEGVVVYAVDGTFVTNQQAIAEAVQRHARFSDDGDMVVPLRIKTAPDAPFVEVTLALDAVQTMELANGVSLATRRAEDGWETAVAVAGARSADSLAEGDILLAERRTEERIIAPDSVELVLDRLAREKSPDAVFLVRRDGMEIEATMPLALEE